jgi:hypothetical protein
VRFGLSGHSENETRLNPVFANLPNAGHPNDIWKCKRQPRDMSPAAHESRLIVLDRGIAGTTPQRINREMAKLQWIIFQFTVEVDAG